MKTWAISALLLLGVLTTNAQNGTGIFINGVQLNQEVVSLFESYYKVKVEKGKYWYDSYCGLWGIEGGAAQGVILANFDFGAPMKANASAGRTGIFINGRQIDSSEETQWKAILGQTIPGRYTLDASGNLYIENGNYVCNVLQLIRNKSPYNDGKGNYFYRNSLLDHGMGGNSEGFYIMGKDWSYSSF